MIRSLSELPFSFWVDVGWTVAFSAVALSAPYLPPRQRIFEASDSAISYPKHESLIPGSVAVAFSLSPGIFLMALAPIVRWSTWFRLLPSAIWGAAATGLLMNILKAGAGRLRPQFFGMCDPKWPQDANDTEKHVYYSSDICTGDPDDIQDAQKSFPSGHAAYSMYGAFWMILFLQRFGGKRLCGPRMGLQTRAVVQFVFLVGGAYVCVSRYADYKHNMSDIAVGALIGLLMASIVVYGIVREQDGRATLLHDSKVAEDANDQDDELPLTPATTQYRRRPSTGPKSTQSPLQHA